jgi:hypothetical protein
LATHKAAFATELDIPAMRVCEGDEHTFEEKQGKVHFVSHELDLAVRRSASMPSSFRVLVALCSFCLSAIPVVSQPNPRTAPKPVLVLCEGRNGAINDWTAPAKFALHNDGTVFTETSDEISGVGDELKYYRSVLTPAEMKSLIVSLSVNETMTSAKNKYGAGIGSKRMGSRGA